MVRRYSWILLVIAVILIAITGLNTTIQPADHDTSIEPQHLDQTLPLALIGFVDTSTKIVPHNPLDQTGRYRKRLTRYC